MAYQNAMRYKDFYGLIEYSDKEKKLVGTVRGVTKIPAFRGESVQEMEKLFHDAVDRYLADCEKKGKHPQTICRGIFTVRTTPELQRTFMAYAHAHGQTFNKTVENALLEFAIAHQLESVSEEETGTGSGLDDGQAKEE